MAKIELLIGFAVHMLKFPENVFNKLSLRRISSDYELLSMTELNNSVEDYNSSRVGVVCRLQF